MGDSSSRSRRQRMDGGRTRRERSNFRSFDDSVGETLPEPRSPKRRKSFCAGGKVGQTAVPDCKGIEVNVKLVIILSLKKLLDLHTRCA